MRKSLLILVPIVSFLFFSCKKTDTPLPTPKPTPQLQLKIDSTTLNLSGNIGAVDSFMVEFSGKWAIVTNPSTATWLKTSVSSGTGNAKVYVSVDQDNKTGAAQTATIVVTPDGDTTIAMRITVTQRVYEVIPTIFWSKAFGGSENEDLNSMVKTPDGGYIAVGGSKSKDGDVNINKGEYDIWVMKVDGSGNKVWEKTFGSTISKLGAAITTSSDGGYFIEAQTWGNDGDVSGLHFDPAKLSQPDLWILKIDGNGNLLWQKALGGTDMDYYTTHGIVGTPDGGCVVAANTMSNDGDVSGNHGNMDAWVVKLNSSGSIVWQKALGGTQWDNATCITVTADGYVIGGYTSSNDGDVSGNHGNSFATDAWVVKIDANGNPLWQKALGGSGDDRANSIISTADGGYIIAGNTNSTDGDVTGNHGGTGDDAWIVKMDGSGNIVWQKAFGGTADDGASSIISTSKNDYMITGYTASNDGDVTGIHREWDAWVVEIDANGNLIWQKTFGGTGVDYGGTIITSNDGNYVISGNTSSNDGDVSGNHGKSDGWIVKFRDK